MQWARSLVDGNPIRVGSDILFGHGAPAALARPRDHNGRRRWRSAIVVRFIAALTRELQILKWRLSRLCRRGCCHPLEAERSTRLSPPSLRARRFMQILGQ